MAARVKKGDLVAGTTRIKELEVAWDSREAAMKPAWPEDWHAMDSAVDGALTARRATPATESASTAALTNLQFVIATLEKKQ